MRTTTAIIALLILAGAACAQSAPPVFGLLGQSSQTTVAQPVAHDPYADAYARLTPEQRAQVDDLLAMQVAPAAGFPRRLNATEQGVLKSLVADGILLERASDGLTALTHLHEMVACGKGSAAAVELMRVLRSEDLTAAKAACDAAGAKGHSLPGGAGEITQCTTHMTCGAASMQVWTRLNRPAELVRIAHQLFCDGRAPLTDTALKVARNSLTFHAGMPVYEDDDRDAIAGTEDRTDLDIVVQSAIMDKIAVGNLSAYDVDLDSGGRGNVMRGNSGSHPLYLKREMERLTGQGWDYQHNLNPLGLGGFGRFFGNLRARSSQDALVAALTGTRHAFMCYQTKPDDEFALHWVTVVGTDASGAVYYVDTCETKATRSKLYKMSKADLAAKLRCVVYPR